MNIEQESVIDFRVGHGSADAVARQIVESGRIRKAYKGVRVRAATANTVTIYVGRQNVTATDGYPLPATEEVVVPIEDPSKVYVVATPASNCQQTVTLSGQIAGDTFTLTFDGETTAPISVTAATGTVQSALQALSTIGTGNCTVGGSAGAYTVTFTGALAKTNVDLMTATGSGVNEKQTITIPTAAAGDLFTPSYDETPGTEVAYTADAATVQGALEAIPALDGNIAVTGDHTAGWAVEFINDLEKQDIATSIDGVCGKNTELTLAITSPVAGDTLTVSIGEGGSGPLTYPVTGAQLQTGLHDGGFADNVAVDGNGPYVIEYTGVNARQDFTDSISATCGKNEKQHVALVSPTSGDFLVLNYEAASTSPVAYDADSAALITAFESIPLLNGQVAVTPGTPSGWDVEFVGDCARSHMLDLTGTCGRNEKQLVTITGGASGDKLVLSYGGAPAGEVNYNANAGTVEEALQDIPALAGNVDVSAGDPTGWVVEFVDGLEGQHTSDLTGVCGKNEKQTIGIPDTVDTGTFTLTYGTATDPIAYNADHAAVQSALEAIPALTGNVTVTGGPGPTADWTVEFVNGLARQSGKITAATSSCGQNEKQSITLTSVTGGTFTLSYDGGGPTDAIAYDASNTTIQTKLQAIPALTGKVTVTGTSPVWTVEFTGTLGLGATVALLSAADVDLEGDGHSVDTAQVVDGTTATVTLTETVAGHSATVNVTETVQGHDTEVVVTELVQGANRSVAFTKTQSGHDATVVNTETQKGDTTCSVAIAKVADITTGSQYSWLAC